MRIIRDEEFGGERPLYTAKDLRLEQVVIHAGESSIKESRNIEAVKCRFEGKYLLWENTHCYLEDCDFTSGARSSFWYNRDCRMTGCRVDAPKMFRRSEGVVVRDTVFSDGQEMLWDCRNVNLNNVTIENCDYLFMHSSNIRISNYRQNGNYSFQYAKNVEIHDAVINSKDAFWESENVTVYDSEINGEYLGWYAKNLRLVRCHLTGEQLLCYVDGLVLEDCTFGEDANLLFEYSSVKGNVKGDVTSIKNPTEYDLKIEGECHEWIFDENRKQSGVKYDFDEVIDRRGTNSVKWDLCENEDMLPLWVADMDFKVAQPIIDAMQRRLDHPVYGYVDVPQSYYDAILGWFSRRHALELKKEWIIYTTGVVPAISAVIKAVTKPGDNVAILTPVYNCFFSSIRNNGCNTDEVALRRVGDSFEIDFEEFERHCSNSATTAFLLCNPHNPAGRVWTEEELRRLGDICLKHNVFVISDEIHCEFIMPGHKHIPYFTLGEKYRAKAAMCFSASKAFNLAGLQTANIAVPGPDYRKMVDKAININEVCDLGTFGPIATQTAYNLCEDWLDQLNVYISENYAFALDFFKEHISALKPMRLEGTYLMFVDVSALGCKSEELVERLKKECGLWFASGTHYGSAGEGYVRINLACPRTTLTAALNRLAAFAA